MAIRAIWGFEHVPINTTYGVPASGYGIILSGYPVAVANVLSGTTSAYVVDGGVACNFSARAPLLCRLRITLNSLTDGVSPKSFIAFTITRKTGTGSLGGAPIVSIGVAPVVLASDYTHVLEERNQVELCIDRVKKRIVVFINNKIKRIINSAALVDNFSNELLYLGNNGYSLTAAQFGVFVFKDFIFIDDTQDDSPCTRPGQSVIVNNPLTEAFADWTTNAASVSASITTPLTNNLTTPVAQSLPDAPSALSFKINSAVSNDYDIKAITFIATMNKIQATPTKLKIAGDLNNTNTVITNAQLPATVTPSVPIALFTNFNNTPLAQINTVNFSITPVTA